MTPTFKSGQATLVQTIDNLQEITGAFRKAGRPVVLVPTMGALHAGHLQLVRVAKRIPGALVVVSIFVNPLQFAEGEDLDAYPRTLDADVELLRGEGADVVFAPSAREMYPNEFRTTVQPGALGTVLEGAFRPTHFTGVLTVVNKLFNIVGPTDAIFGEKDYQQLILIQQMVTDLNMGIRIHGVPIVREASGLAMSSRNRYLSEEEHEVALGLSAALTAGAHASESGADAVLAAARSVLAAVDGLDVDYLELRRASDLGEISEDKAAGDARLLIAARVGTTRLIDNAGILLGEVQRET
ncbi:pantoate--beta-alanine ligase [Corynebacterium durum]|uniref:pantoate--beta-alanine ligase n=1 Tax=Corynebacterium durum TaxID=61592 RepID=UPI002880A315|nr:pantoate--beta-alanine ligase [Corynebacterium durum]